MNMSKIASSPITRLIFIVVVVHLLVGVFVHAYWMKTANDQVLHIYFDYEGSLVFLLCASLQLWLSVLVFREFTLQQPLGAAWFYIMLSSGCVFVGTLLSHVLAVKSALNPLSYGQWAADSHLRNWLWNIGTVIGGPMYMILLGTGLYLVLRVYKRLGMLSKLKAVDIVLIGAAMAYSIIVMIGIVEAVRSNPAGVTAEHALTWPGDYLLSILLLEAVFLRRSAVNMGWGYVSKIWGAFAVGIFLTSFCSLMNWLMAYGFLTWSQIAFTWYLWYPAYAALALAPAYQWEAMRTAERRLAQRVDELEFSVS